jgi:hypothetical protein
MKWREDDEPTMLESLVGSTIMLGITYWMAFALFL